MFVSLTDTFILTPLLRCATPEIRERVKASGRFFWCRLLSLPYAMALETFLCLFWPYLTAPSRIPGTFVFKYCFVKYTSRRLGFQLSFTSENFLISNHCTFTRLPASCVGIWCCAWDVVTQLRPRLKSKMMNLGLWITKQMSLFSQLEFCVLAGRTRECLSISTGC